MNLCDKNVCDNLAAYGETCATTLRSSVLQDFDDLAAKEPDVVQTPPCRKVGAQIPSTVARYCRISSTITCKRASSPTKISTFTIGLRL